MMFKQTAAIMAIVIVAFAGSVCPAADDLVLVDAEGADSVTVANGEVSSEQAKTGSASIKWADHPSRTSLRLENFPTDWSAFNQVSVWMYSAVANDAEFMFLIVSENPDSDGMDYWSTEIAVDWTGWKHFEFPFFELGATRKPIGWQQITGVSFTATGWQNEPKPDTVIYLDDFCLSKIEYKVENTDFEAGAGADGVPAKWEVFPGDDTDETRVEVAPEGRSGKGALIIDQSKKNGVGIQQMMPCDAGKTYTLSCWKKGAIIGLYIKFRDERMKEMQDDIKHEGAKNQDPSAFERFEVSTAAPEGAAFIQVWLYSYTSNVGEAVVDDVKLEVVE